MGDGFEVGRIHAQPIPAQMIKLKSRWNRPDEEIVNHSMGVVCAVRLGMRRYSITAILAEPARPDPAAISGRPLDLGLKTSLAFSKREARSPPASPLPVRHAILRPAGTGVTACLTAPWPRNHGHTPAACAA